MYRVILRYYEERLCAKSIFMKYHSVWVTECDVPGYFCSTGATEFATM